MTHSAKPTFIELSASANSLILHQTALVFVICLEGKYCGIEVPSFNRENCSRSQQAMCGRGQGRRITAYTWRWGSCRNGLKQLHSRLRHGRNLMENESHNRCPRKTHCIGKENKLYRTTWHFRVFVKFAILIGRNHVASVTPRTSKVRISNLPVNFLVNYGSESPDYYRPRPVRILCDSISFRSLLWPAPPRHQYSEH